MRLDLVDRRDRSSLLFSSSLKLLRLPFLKFLLCVAFYTCDLVGDGTDFFGHIGNVLSFWSPICCFDFSSGGLCLPSFRRNRCGVPIFSMLCLFESSLRIRCSQGSSQIFRFIHDSLENLLREASKYQSGQPNKTSTFWFIFGAEFGDYRGPKRCDDILLTTQSSEHTCFASILLRGPSLVLFALTSREKAAGRWCPH